MVGFSANMTLEDYPWNDFVNSSAEYNKTRAEIREAVRIEALINIYHYDWLVL